MSGGVAGERRDHPAVAYADFGWKKKTGRAQPTLRLNLVTNKMRHRS